MGTLVYGMIVSLDGYIEDGNGSFDWAEPQEDVHRYFNEMESRSEILMYGRKLYEIMSVWESIGDKDGQPEYISEYARIWKSKQKMVFSKSLEKVGTSNTVLKNDFIASEVQGIKESTKGNISIGGAELASTALRLNLLDEIYLCIVPVITGNGKKWIDYTLLDGLHLVGSRQFSNDVIMVHYRINKT